MPLERVQRALARAGVGSRRACEELVAAGRVTINGRTASLGDKVDSTRDRVGVDGDRVPLDPELRYFALNKPRGVVSTLGDPHRRKDLTAFLPGDVRVFPVGRLDADSEGLVILTNDGELANRLLHPRYQVEKEYLVEVRGRPTDQMLAQLVRGIDLEDGPARALAANLAGSSRDRGAVRVVMGEGRKREVRRMLAALGFPVTRLVRVRLGPIVLGRTKPGSVRELSAEEIRALYRDAGL
jgi:23S rRNA pseudouridine2605 synthase